MFFPGYLRQTRNKLKLFKQRQAYLSGFRSFERKRSIFFNLKTKKKVSKLQHVENLGMSATILSIFILPKAITLSSRVEIGSVFYSREQKSVEKDFEGATFSTVHATLRLVCFKNSNNKKLFSRVCLKQLSENHNNFVARNSPGFPFEFISYVISRQSDRKIKNFDFFLSRLKIKFNNNK